MIRKGVILAGGRGTRLDPLTRVTSKQLLPVYDQPMIFYPLGLMMRCGIREIAIVTSPEWTSQYQQLLGDGSQWGIEISYVEQDKPRGVPDGLVVAEDWLAGEPCCFALGDNLFLGDLTPVFHKVDLRRGAAVFAIHTTSPQNFGIIELGLQGEILSIVEKPSEARSPLAIPGFYLLDGSASRRAAELQPSSRGETEICALLESYRSEGLLICWELPPSIAWLDAGTPDDLLQAAQQVATAKSELGCELVCLEEIGWRAGWLNDTALKAAAAQCSNSDRKEYLIGLLAG